MREKSGHFDPSDKSIKVITLHAGNGLERLVGVLAGAGHMPIEVDDECEEARLFYVGATRATKRLEVGG